MKIPFSAVQTALYNTMSMSGTDGKKIIGIETYDSATPNEEIETAFENAERIAYAIYGNVNADIETNSKSEYIWNIKETIDVYSNYNGRKELNAIMQKIIEHLSSDEGFANLSNKLRSEGYELGQLSVDNININNTLYTDVAHWHTGNIIIGLVLTQIE